MVGLGETRGRSPGASREDARGAGGHRDDRPVPAPLAGEPPGRRVRASGRLRAVPRGGRGDGVPARLCRAVRALVLSGRRVLPRSSPHREAADNDRAGGEAPPRQRGAGPLALHASALASGLLFALAFPPLEWVLLLPVAPVPWLVALAAEESRGRALLSGFLFGMAYWCASIPWIFYVVTHYGGQGSAMGVVCLGPPRGDPRGVAGARRVGDGGVRAGRIRRAARRLSASLDGVRARALLRLQGIPLEPEWPRPLPPSRSGPRRPRSGVFTESACSSWRPRASSPPRSSGPG